MRSIRDIGRLGMFAVGLGVGAAMAATPGTASADPFDVTGAGLAASTAADSLVGSAAAAPAQAFDPTNFAVSIDGINLLEGGSATATSVFGGIAVADGANSSANADGFLDIATAQGVDSTANTLGSVELAGAVGNHSEVIDNAGAVDAGFANGLDTLAETGGSQADPGFVDAAFANGAGSDAEAGLFGADPTGVSVDLASASDGLTAIANSGPFDMVFAPPLAAAADPGFTDLLGDGVGSTASLSDFWSELLTLF